MEEHKDLKFCGRCPFLLSAVSYESLFCHPRHRKDLSDTAEWAKIKERKQHPRIKNECAVSKYYFGREESPGDLAYELLNEGMNPKRKKGCLKLATHILSQYGCGI